MEVKAGYACEHLRVPAKRGQQNQPIHPLRMSTCKCERSGSTRGLAADKHWCDGLSVRIQNGKRAFRQTLDSVLHRVETVVERENAHAAKQPRCDHR